MCLPDTPEQKEPKALPAPIAPKTARIRGKRGLRARETGQALRQDFNPLAIVTPERLNEQVASIGNSLSIAGPGVPNLY